MFLITAEELQTTN